MCIVILLLARGYWKVIQCHIGNAYAHHLANGNSQLDILDIIMMACTNKTEILLLLGSQHKR